MNKHFTLILINIFLFIPFVFSQKLVYENDPLVLKANSLEDGLGTICNERFAQCQPKKNSNTSNEYNFNDIN